MDAAKMLMHIKAGGFAMRRGWGRARLTWHRQYGPVRNDTGQDGLWHFVIISCEEWIAEDWIKVNKDGVEIG